VSVVEGYLGAQAGLACLFQVGKKVDVPFELTRCDDVRVVASARSQFVVEKVESAWWVIHRVGLNSTSNVVLTNIRVALAESYREPD
jgi:hypothetical protein